MDSKFRRRAFGLLGAVVLAGTCLIGVVGTGGVAGAATFSGQAVVNAAASQAGIPYCYGGGGPNGPGPGSGCGGANGFDCTGLTLYAIYQASGGAILLPHSGAQATAAVADGGQVISNQSDLQPGDLVYFGGTFGSFEHSGIYAGGGYFWDANDYGVPVQEHSLAWEEAGLAFVGGVRLWSGGGPNIEPTIANANRSFASVDQSVTVNGNNLGNAQVAFGGVVATVTHATDTQVVAVVPASAKSGTLSVTTQYGSAAVPFTVAPPGDINGDGNSDVVMAVPDGSGGVNYEYGLSLGNGHFLLQSAVGLSGQPAPVAMAMGDINGDGNSDVVMAVPDGSGGVNYEYGLSLGNGHFLLQSAVGLSGQPAPVAMAMGDINGDGNSDVVMAVPDGSGGVNYEYGLSLGNGHFLLQSAVGLSGQPAPVAMAMGDINGDGNSDVVMAVPDGSGGVNYEYGLSLGNGHFLLQSAVGLSGQPAPVAMAMGDINGDGNSDVVMAVPDGSGGVNYEYGLSLGNGHFLLQSAVGLSGQPAPVAMAMGDINGDGNSDVVMAVPDGSGGVNYEYGLSLGNGHFLLQSAVGLSGQPAPVEATSGSTSLIAPSVNTALTATEVLNVPFSVTVTSTGTPTPSLAESGTLPTGVTFTDNGDGTGTLAGTPAPGSAGTYPVTLSATNGVGSPATQAFTLTVVNLEITTSSLPGGTVKTPYSATLAASGGNPPYTWKLAKGSKLPKGLKLSKKTGQITGTPKAAGTTTVTVDVADTKTKTKPKTQNVASATFTITVS